MSYKKMFKVVVTESVTNASQKIEFFQGDVGTSCIKFYIKNNNKAFDLEGMSLRLCVKDTNDGMIYVQEDGFEISEEVVGEALCTLNAEIMELVGDLVCHLELFDETSVCKFNTFNISIKTPMCRE